MVSTCLLGGHYPRGLTAAPQDDITGRLHIANGLPGITGGMLPYIEEEAIARLRHHGLTVYSDEPTMKRENWEHWRHRWNQEAHYFLQTATCGPVDASTTYAAAEALVTASRLRYAIEDGSAEKAAALAMLLISWVHIGGLSIRFGIADKTASVFKNGQQKRAKKARTTIKLDEGGVRKLDFVEAALLAAGAEASTPDVWLHLFGELDRRGMSPAENGAKERRSILATDTLGASVTFTFKGVQTMMRKLREGKAAQTKLGRPKKKPA